MREDDQFVKEYEGFVRAIALQTRAQLGLDSAIEDLVAFGFQGLLEARQRFDASKGVAFKSFAYYRVRGAILDGVRAMARLPRRAYARLRAAEALDQSSEQGAEQQGAAQRTPSVEGTLRSIDSILGRVAAAYTVAVTVEDAEQGAGSPEEALLHEERLTRMRAAVAKLPERERHMIEGHYFQGKRFDALSAELGISKSWGSRVYAHALDMLREAMFEP
ncbi:MAG TPA: sigma-70 family RNA polymerase sigma factor [Polyangiales bacterium]|jgi:RNA polymerase sigma factor for flagellar operon FliA|nr:sigma-70 family RNA polymerase sigma factor [Polyangiales bacterium]